MVFVRRTVEEARAEAAGQVNLAKLDATTEEDIRRHMVEDGFDPDAPFAGLVPRGRVSPRAVRERSGLSQDKFATALRIPVKTLRNWEQGRTVPDPAAQSLLDLIASDPHKHIEDLRPESIVAVDARPTQEARMLTRDDVQFLLRMQQERSFPSHGEAARIRDIERKLRAIRLAEVLDPARR